MDHVKEAYKYIGILRKSQRSIMWRWLKGWNINEIASENKTSEENIKKSISNAVDKIDKYCYNRERYLSIFGHLFDELGRNMRRIHPVRCFDDRWGLTKTEVWLLKMWKVDGSSVNNMLRKLRICQNTLDQYKTKVAKKAGINDIERRNADNTLSDSDFSNDIELSAF